jgi:uncharacterized protein YdeI (YjbR/CyaY-like superfamily)
MRGADVPQRQPVRSVRDNEVMPDNQPTLFFEDDRAFEQWLSAEHANVDGVWLKFAKKDSGIKSLNYRGALDVALCYGWIDGQAKRIDETYYVQRFTPRRARSKWSKINRDKVAELIASGRMQPPGLAEIERAKADGRWDAAYDSPANATVPDDLQAALDANPAAGEFFATLKGQNRYAILFRIQDAKRPETRARRIEKFVDMLARGETLH